MVFTTEGLFEVAIESWPEWDLNPRPLNSVQNSSIMELNSGIMEPLLDHDAKYKTMELLPRKWLKV